MKQFVKRYYVWCLVGCMLVGCAPSADKVAAAAVAGDVARVEQLLAKKPKLNRLTKQGYTPLLAASAAQKTEIVQMLLAAGADANIQAASSAEEDAGLTALLIACQHDYPNVAKALLDGGADVNFPSDKGNTPLGVASETGHTEIVKLLLQARANIDTPNAQGMTPLMLASHYGHTDVVRLLLRYHANLSLKDASGQTAFDYARKPRIVLLLEQAPKK